MAYPYGRYLEQYPTQPLPTPNPRTVYASPTATDLWSKPWRWRPLAGQAGDPPAVPDPAVDGGAVGRVNLAFQVQHCRAMNPGPQGEEESLSLSRCGILICPQWQHRGRDAVIQFIHGRAFLRQHFAGGAQYQAEEARRRSLSALVWSTPLGSRCAHT